MADYTEKRGPITVKFHDNGDGTWSEVVYTGGAGGTTDGAASPNQSTLVGGEYNSALPTLSNGTASTMQLDSSGRLITTLGTALSQSLDSVLTYPRGSNYQELSASGLVLTGAGKLRGIFCAAASSTPTIKVWDNTSAATTVLLDTFTPVAGTQYTFPDARANTGIYVTISGTVSCTVFYDPTTT